MKKNTKINIVYDHLSEKIIRKYILSVYEENYVKSVEKNNNNNKLMRSFFIVNIVYRYLLEITAT